MRGTLILPEVFPLIFEVRLLLAIGRVELVKVVRTLVLTVKVTVVA